MGCKNGKCGKFDFPKMSEEEKNSFYQSVFSSKNKNHFVDMPDRFVLEEDISHQEDINDQINLLIEDILDNPDLVDADDIVNTLMGIVAVHELRTNKLWQHFKTIYELDEYSPKRACNSDNERYNPDMRVDPFDPFKE